jgi:predicted DNA-binding transcriptional regulator YafY
MGAAPRGSFGPCNSASWTARALFAWCELRGDFRMFHTDRIASMMQLERYPTSRTELVRRLKPHLAAQADWKGSPYGNRQGMGLRLCRFSSKEIAMTTEITHGLPKVVADHIAACNAHDIEPEWRRSHLTPCTIISRAS